MEFLHRTWAEISKSALVHNLNEIKKKASGAKLMAVVKADAYGHSAKLSAPVLEENGVDFFAVSNIEEALSLRTDGIKKPILILGYTPVNYVKTLAENDISQCVYSYEYAKALSCSAKASGVRLSVHIKLDTGMARIGFDLREGDGGIKEAVLSAKLPCFNVQGVFTHFAVADSQNREDTEFTAKQYSKFLSGVKALEKEGIKPEYIHSDNSAAFCTGGHSGNAVRTGIILYGLKPDRNFNTGLDLKPVMTVKSVVSFVKEIKAGTSVSYGRTFTAKKDMKIATVAAGYADGYPRKLSNKGEVLIDGKRAKIIGRVCMDQFMIDVSDIDNVAMGDEVILFGEQLSVDEIAEKCDTINYEIVCGIAPRVPRVEVE